MLSVRAAETELPGKKITARERMFMNSVIDLTAYLPEQPAPRRRMRQFGSIAAAVETAVTLLMGIGFLLALTAFLLAL